MWATFTSSTSGVCGTSPRCSLAWTCSRARRRWRSTTSTASCISASGRAEGWPCARSASALLERVDLIGELVDFCRHAAERADHLLDARVGSDGLLLENAIRLYLLQ